MADIVERSNCKQLIEWPNLVYWLDIDVYKIGCNHCVKNGKKLIGDYR
jgi:hypothetical protein